MKTNWNKVKQAYIEDEPITYSELAEKFKIGLDNLQHRGAKENWAEQRKLFSHKVETLRVEKKSEIMASESAQFDSDCLKVARAGIGMVVGEMKTKTTTVAQLSTALANFQKVGKLAFGEQSTDTGAGIDITYRVINETTPNEADKKNV